jgi:hypothetical protein
MDGQRELAEREVTAVAPASVPAGAPHPLLALQRAAGNASVCRLVSQLRVARDAPGGTMTPPVAVGGLTDSEGNAVDTTGLPHLTAVPAAATWHKGIAQALPPDPLATFAGLYKQCTAIAAEQAAFAASLKGDMKYWFARVYMFVTLNELKQIDAGTYQYPLMKMQEVVAFHATYKQNLDRWRSGAKGKVESNWKAAFGAAEAMNDGSYVRTKAMEIMAALLPSMEAHIRFDLPRAVAAVYERNYAPIPGLSLALFKPDFDAMSVVFERAAADLSPEIKAACWMVDPGYSQTLRDVGFPAIFHVGIERQLTWEKAALIYDAHKKGILAQPDIQKRLKANIIGAHPNTGPDTFEVDDIKVEDYDWNAQP